MFGTGGVRTAQQFAWELMAQSRERLYTPRVWRRLDGYSAYDDVPMPADRIRRRHPLNQSLYMSYQIMLPGLLMAAKGDRVDAPFRHRGRYPFLDERVVAFCAAWRRSTSSRLDRQMAAPPRRRPRAAAADRQRTKTMFRADMGQAFVGPNRPRWVDQLLSPESLRSDRLFRSGRGADAPARSQLSKPAKFAASLLARHGLDRRHRHAVVAPHLLRRRTVPSCRRWTPPDLSRTPALWQDGIVASCCRRLFLKDWPQSHRG